MAGSEVKALEEGGAGANINLCTHTHDQHDITIVKIKMKWYCPLALALYPGLMRTKIEIWEDSENRATSSWNQVIYCYCHTISNVPCSNAALFLGLTSNSFYCKTLEEL